MRPLLRTFAVTAAGTLAATLVAGPASAVPTTTINPAKLPRGADLTIPHLEKKTVVDGSVRVRVKAPTVRLLGKSGSAYVVGTADRSGAHGRILRINADGTSIRLARANIYLTELSGDGQTIVSTRPTNSRTAVTVRSATTGAGVADKTFRGYVSVLDADTDRVLVGTVRKTRLWTTTTGTVANVSKTGGYAGDLSADVFAAYTKDPYRGGCTVVSKISTGAPLWKSCKERVDAFNSDGSAMATIDILSDGIGPAWVGARAITGKKLGDYRVRDGWFGEVRFETTTALLLQTNGVRKAATVRCTGTNCERASDLTDTEQPRHG